MPNLVLTALAKVDLQANHAFDGTEAETIRTAYKLNVMRPQGTPLVRQVQLLMQMGLNQKDSPRISYFGEMLVLAEVHFEQAEQSSDDYLDERAAWVGAPILTGMVRSHVQIITALGPFQGVLLSPVLTSKLVANASVYEKDGAEPRPLKQSVNQVIERERPRLRSKFAAAIRSEGSSRVVGAPPNAVTKAIAPKVKPRSGTNTRKKKS